MITLQAKNKTLRLAENCKEVKLSQFIDYDIYKRKWIDSINNFGLFSLESLTSIRELLFNWFEKNEAIDSIPIDVDTESTAALKIIKHIDKVIESLKPTPITKDNHSFEYKGEVFYIPFQEAFEHLQLEFNRPSLTLGEVVELMEYKRLTEKMLSENEDTEGNFKFTESLRTVSILARKENEILPSVKTESWIFDRMTFFKDISLQDYFDVHFFLTVIGTQLKMTNNSSIFLTLRKELLEPKSKWN